MPQTIEEIKESTRKLQQEAAGTIYTTDEERLALFESLMDKLPVLIRKSRLVQDVFDAEFSTGDPPGYDAEMAKEDGRGQGYVESLKDLLLVLQGKKKIQDLTVSMEIFRSLAT